jgi:8-amino-7-oxononanoate synthase
MGNNQTCYRQSQTFSMNNNAKTRMLEMLALRAQDGSLRELQYRNNLCDFSSNDYLGFARSMELRLRIDEELRKFPQTKIGSTGSRLLSGNSRFAEDLEKQLAKFHKAGSALMFTSGYTANTALFSSLPQKGDTVIHDEYIHGSVIDGIRTSFAKRRKFRHNDLDDLEKQLKRATGSCFVAVESVYSMGGDLADLLEIIDLCSQYGAQLIVDEAHAFGVYGTGIVDELSLHEFVFARVITFSKALGLHGAMVLGPDYLKEYLINFARPFIYTTAPPISHLVSVQVAYGYLLENPQFQEILRKKGRLLKEHMPPQGYLSSTRNASAIQYILLEGNKAVVDFAISLSRKGFDVGAIRSPTVPVGKERIRICVHTHNTDEEIIQLCEYFHQFSRKKNVK